MKKILSLVLAIMMLVSIIPTASAETIKWTCYVCGSDRGSISGTSECGHRVCINCGHCSTCYNEYLYGTEVVYEGQGTEQYTVTVPALLAPGSSGDVTLQGTWGSYATVKVTADTSVELTNSINAADKKVLDIEFTGIELAGSNTAAVTDTKAVSVADIENALFGTWSGKFNYNVEFVGPFEFTITNTPDIYTYEALPGMTWSEWIDSGYNTSDGLIKGYGPQYVYFGGKYLASNNKKVNLTDEIIPGHNYGYVYE